MTSASPAVTVLACAELTEWTKLNVEIPFPAIPSVAELIDAMNRVFSFELQQHLQEEQQKGASNQSRSSSQPISMRRFEVESVTVYDDSLVRWVDLNSSAQLHPFDQLYVFGKGIPPYAGSGGASDSDNGLPPPKLSDYFHYHQPPAAAAQSTSSVQPVQQQQQRRSTSNHNFIADEQQPAHHQARPQQQQQQQQQQQAQPLGAREPEPQQPRAAAYQQQQQPAQQTRDNGHYAQRPREEQQQQQPSSVMAAHGQTTMQQQPPAQHQNARPMQSTPQPTPPPGHHQQSTPGRSQQDPAKVSKVYAYADRAGRGHGPISFHDFHSVMNSVYIAFDDRTLQDMFVHFSTGSATSANANGGTGGNDQQSSQPVMSHQDFSVWASHYPRTFDALHHRLADREMEDAKRNDLSQVQRELDRMTQRRRQLEDEMRKLDAEVEGRTQQFASLDREVQDVQRGRRALCDDEQVLLDKEVKIAHNRILLQQEEQDYERTAKQLDMRRSQARQPSSSCTQHYAQQQPSQHY